MNESAYTTSMKTKMTASYRWRRSPTPPPTTTVHHTNSSTLLVVLFACLLSIVVRLPSCHARVSYCKLKNTIVHVQLVDGKFIRSPDDMTNTVDGIGRTRRRRRNLRGDEEQQQCVDLDNNNNMDINSTSSTTNNNKSTSTIYNAKECSCATSSSTTAIYCLYTSNNENVCEVPTDVGDGGRQQQPTLCYNVTIYRHIIRNSWPIVVFFYVVVIVYVIFTEGGRGTMRYVYYTVCCRNDAYNEQLVEMIMESEDSERRRTLELQRMVGRRDNVTYVLKTKQYYRKANNGTPTLHTEHDSRASLFPIQIATTTSSPLLQMTPPLYHPFIQPPNQTTDTSTTRNNNNNNNMENLQTATTATIDKPTIDSDDDSDNDEGAETCTICILTIKDGDHIGALQCEHIFHVDCLKEWIKRRNVCPLCQIPNIADERRSPPPPIDTYTNNNDNDIGGSLISTRLNERTRILGRVSPPTRSAVARIRRLMEDRREAVRTLIPGTADSGDIIIAGVGSNGTDDFFNGWERIVRSEDRRSRSIDRVSTNQRSGGSNRRRRRLMESGSRGGEDRRRSIRLRQMEDMSPSPFGL